MPLWRAARSTTDRWWDGSSSVRVGRRPELALQIGPAPDVELAVDAGQMLLDRADGDVEPVGDLPVGVPARGQRGHPELCVAQAVLVAVRSILRLAGRCLRVDTWVLSCRAFSRRIEWATLDFLFDRLKIGDLAFAYAPTPKNHLVADFLRSLADEEPGTEARVTAERFAARKPPLFVRCHTGESA